MKIINVAREFSEVPFGRFRSDSRFSGEAFREDLLIPNLKNESEVEVILDGTEGYGSSFLEESFGGLIRHGFTLDELKSGKLRITANDPEYHVYRDQAWAYMEKETERSG